MKLLTKELLTKFKKTGSQEDVKDPMVLAKFFHVFSDWTWYALEYNEEDQCFFGLVVGFESELGYFSLKEFEEIKIKGLGMERDRYFNPTPLSEIRRKHG